MVIISWREFFCSRNMSKKDSVPHVHIVTEKSVENAVFFLRLGLSYTLPNPSQEQGLVINSNR